MAKTTAAAAQTTMASTVTAVTPTNSPLLPIEVLTNDVAKFKLNAKELQMRNQLIDDIKNAELHTVLSLFYYIKVGKQLIDIKKSFIGKKGEYTKFLESIGMNDRKAQRYTKIAGNKRFAAMGEEEMKRLHHLTQAQLVKMTKFDDAKFDAAIEDKNFDFSDDKDGEDGKSGTGGEKPSDCIIDDTLYQTFKVKDKAYVINEYNELLKRFIELEQQMKGDVVIEADIIPTIDTAANLYTVDQEEVA